MKLKLNYHDWQELKTELTETAFALWDDIVRILRLLLAVIVSTATYVARQIEAFCKRETKAAAIIGFIIFAILISWVMTFCSLRHTIAQTQQTADSLSYIISRYNEVHGTDEYVVIGKDTITYKIK